MRILRIRLKNINSLRGEHEIHFDESPLREADLFGIVGATGSGKSTLLDCITLALYGRVPRMDKPISKSSLEKGGVILTRHEKDALAEVVYASKNGVFTAQWSVSKTRNNTFRDIEMKVINEAGEMLTEKASTAPDVNTANIGLDYDQFMKSILLSQGEFAKFLQSDKNKRAELLEKITGTRVFRQLGQKTFREFNKRKQVLENKEQVIRDVGKDLLAEEDRDVLVAGIQQQASEVQMLQGRWDLARQRLELKTRLAGLRAKLEGLERQMEQREQALAAFQARAGETLRMYELLFPFRDRFREHDRLAQQLATAKQQLITYDQEIRVREAEKEALVSELCTWLGSPVESASYVAVLRKFRDEVRDLQQQRDSAQQLVTDTYTRITASLAAPAFQQEKTLFRPRASNAGLVDSLLRRYKDGEQRLSAILQEQGWDPMGLVPLRGLITRKLADLGLLKGEVRSYLQQLQQVKQSDSLLAELDTQLKAIDLEGQRKLLQDAELAFEQARKQREDLLSAEKLDDLRTRLKDGEPCPLCGATHHPYVHEFAQDLLTSADAFSDTRRKLDAQQQAWKTLVLKHEGLQAGIQREQQARETAAQLQQKAGVQIDIFKQQLGLQKVQHEEKVNELITAEQDHLQWLEECLTIQQALPQLRQLQLEISGYDVQYQQWADVHQAVLARYTGKDIEQDCRDREQRMQAAVQALMVGEERRVSLLQQQAVDQRQWQDLQTSLQEDLAPLGFLTVADAVAKLVPEQQQKQLVKQEQELLQQLAETKAAWKEVREQWTMESAGDDALVTVEMQAAEVERLKVELGRLRQQLEDRRAIVIGDDNRRQQMAGYEAERKQLLDALRPWEMLNKLIGDATGNKFNNKAQELTLQHLLVLANQRMQLLHGRYRLLEPDGDDDLRVADGYMGGEVRTVRSLSGGETFILSLALALGLSDLASRDVKIESLFIDEGFGSLDPETLEEAMSTLEQLQHESNKMVGIISHVESLKERIYTQIRLEKGNSGFSTLTIFPQPTDIDAKE